MGITIDEAIDVLKYLKTQNSQLVSLDVAIETMRKYQKIEQIVSDRYGKPVFKFMDAIVKVVEDEK